MSRRDRANSASGSNRLAADPQNPTTFDPTIRRVSGDLISVMRISERESPGDQDKDLDSLRARDDFKKLIAGLEKGSHKAKP